MECSNRNMKRKALRQVRAGILVVSFTFYLLSCNNKSVKLSDKKIKFPYEDVEDAFVDPLLMLIHYTFSNYTLM